MSSLAAKSLQSEHAVFLGKVQSWLTEDTKSGSLSLSKHPADDRVAVLQIDNPSKRGSISGNMMLELAAHIDTLESEWQPTAVIFASHGPFFSSGLDLNLAKGLINTPEMGAEVRTMMLG